MTNRDTAPDAANARIEQLQSWLRIAPDIKNDKITGCGRGSLVSRIEVSVSLCCFILFDIASSSPSYKKAYMAKISVDTVEIVMFNQNATTHAPFFLQTQ